MTSLKKQKDFISFLFLLKASLNALLDGESILQCNFNNLIIIISNSKTFRNNTKEINVFIPCKKYSKRFIKMINKKNLRQETRQVSIRNIFCFLLESSCNVELQAREFYRILYRSLLLTTTTNY